MQNHLYVIYLVDEIRLVFHYQNHYKRISYQKTKGINPVYYHKWLIINELTHLVNFLDYFSSGFISSSPILSIIFITKAVHPSVEINTINDLIFIIEMDINRKDYSENRLIKRINEARNYKNKYSNMVAAAYASGKSSTEIRDEMSS